MCPEHHAPTAIPKNGSLFMKPKHNEPYRLSQALAAVLLVLLIATPGCAHRKGGAAGSKFGQESGRSEPLLPATGDSASGINFGGDGFAENVPLSGRPSHLSFDSPQVRRDMFEPVYFAFDRYDVDGSELAKIRRVADYLRSHSSSGVIVAGNTDATGTTEYNRNLGERRSLAIRGVLIQQGIAAAQVQTLSFGEDRPAQPGTSESALAANRRAEFGIFDSVSR